MKVQPRVGGSYAIKDKKGNVVLRYGMCGRIENGIAYFSTKEFKIDEHEFVAQRGW